MTSNTQNHHQQLLLAATSTMTSIPPPGEEASLPLELGCNATTSTNLIIRHGSSLSLMSNVCEFLANPTQDDSFNYIDPTVDHHKWARKGMDLYYACVVDGDSTSGIVCALRAATEGIMTTQQQQQKSSTESDQQSKKHHTTTTTTTTKRRRFLIDYVYTAPTHRDRGIAGRLVSSVLEMAQNAALGATCYVLSIEDSCVYWMEKHDFFLVENPALNKLFNVFPDTHLLKRRHACTDDNDSNSDEEEARTRVLQQDSSNGDENDGSDGSSNTISGSTTATTPPDGFTQALQQLLAKKPNHTTDSLRLCLSSLATLIRNAMADDDDDGRRRKCRINNPHVHRRVFAVGGDAALALLQASGFELQVDDRGDAILQFHSAAAGNAAAWLSAAVAQLQSEADNVGW